MKPVITPLARWVLLVMLLAGGLAARPAQAAPGPWIDPLVQADLRQTGQAEVLVEMRAQVGLPGLRAAAGLGAAPAQRTLAIRALLVRTAARSQAGLLARLEQAGLRPRAHWGANVIALTVDQAVLHLITARTDVARILSNRPARVRLEQPAALALQAAAAVEPPWNLAMTGAPALWKAGFTGQGIVVAGADTGYDWQHPQLKAAYLGWDGEQADHDHVWWDAVRRDLNGTAFNPCGYANPQPCDDAGHGTHTLGTMVSPAWGMAPGARWIGCRNMDSGFGTPESYLECLEFFLAPWDQAGQHPDPERRPDVVNNSYSCLPSEGCDNAESFAVLEQAVDALRAAGTAVVVSAGNSGPGCSTLQAPPAAARGAITVGSVNSAGVIAPSSSRGPVADWQGNLLLDPEGRPRLGPVLAAPGVDVVSTIPRGGTQSLSGTSMAAPHVAGAIALLWSARPALRGDVDETLYWLAASARHIPDDSACGIPGDHLANYTYGYGIVDVAAAYEQRVSGLYRIYLPGVWQ